MNFLKSCVYLFVIFVLIFSAQATNADLNKSFNFKSMIEELENKYPIVEKQATTLLKMLRSTKHVKIQIL